MCLNFFPMILHVVSSYVRLCFGTCLKNMSEPASEFGLNKKEMTFSAPCYLIRPSVVVGIDYFLCLALLPGTVILADGFTFFCWQGKCNLEALILSHIAYSNKTSIS